MNLVLHMYSRQHRLKILQDYAYPFTPTEGTLSAWSLCHHNGDPHLHGMNT